MKAKTEETLVVPFERCCLESLEEIRVKHEVGKLLQSTLAGSPLAILAGRFIPGALTITTLDWELLARALVSVPSIVKNRCRLISASEALKHPGGPLNKFWMGLYDSFR